jgi:hypothetical protein
MSNGRRRPKLLRAQLRPSDSGVLKEGRVAKQRTRATQIALVAISMLVCAALVHGSGPPFTYRIGQRPDRQLRVKVKDFRIRNQTKTSNERQAAADQVPPSLINDPGPVQELAEKLDDLTVVIAKSARLEDLHENVRSVWKLTPESYLDLKSATDTPERRDNLHAQITGAFTPMLRDGVLGPDTLPPNEESSRLLSIRKAGDPVSAARCRAIAWSRSGSSSLRGQSIKSFARSSRPRGSARSFSA